MADLNDNDKTQRFMPRADAPSRDIDLPDSAFEPRSPEPVASTSSAPTSQASPSQEELAARQAKQQAAYDRLNEQRAQGASFEQAASHAETINLEDGAAAARRAKQQAAYDQLNAKRARQQQGEAVRHQQASATPQHTRVMPQVGAGAHSAPAYNANGSARDPQTVPERSSKKGGAGRFFFELVVIVVLALGLAWLITHFIAQPYEIPSGSMEQTIQIGDRVLAEKVSYRLGEPERGDIVTFYDLEDDDRVLIKRVIATGGQTVDLRDGFVWVDGVMLDEPYTHGQPSEPLDAELVYPYTIPEGYIWVMGDNRTNSSDSRHFGPVPLDRLTGRAFMRYWPISNIGFLE